MKLIRRRSSESGFSLPEVLVVVGLFGLVAASIAISEISMLNGRGQVFHDSIASQLAIEALEGFAGLDPSTFGNANDSVTDIVREGIVFHRVIDVTVMSDGSREVFVEISCDSCRRGGEAELTNTFPLWGST
jgi:prepilin-type N-terminal cleavage/methylation domain-containing protein